MDATVAGKLREPFPTELIGKLPRVTCRDCQGSPERACGRHSKTTCGECRNYITSAHAHLDYVGHAATTDRLLKVDPAWSWEPFSVDANGLPAISNGGLWIRLTVAGVTRPGYGDGKSVKEMIGDAIRNAAMRFGVALDLWAKEDLHLPDETPKVETDIVFAADVHDRIVSAESLDGLRSLWSEVAASAGVRLTSADAEALCDLIKSRREDIENPAPESVMFE